MLGMADHRGSRSVLKLPLDEAKSQIRSQIEVGLELLETNFPHRSTEERDSVSGGELFITAISTPWLRGAGRLMGPSPALEALKHRIDQWHDYNCTWLDRNIGGDVAEEYRNSEIETKKSNPVYLGRYLCKRLESEISRLQSIHERLHMWVPAAEEVSALANPAQLASDGAIFIVHGSDTLRAERVARAVNKATSRETIILREQPSLGQTLIEKFEQHAANASYAIVVLTPDDQGRRKDVVKLTPRGRQNVIFEMGYFYGVLGRSRVSVLLHPGVEKPSDMDGVVYINFDDNGAWKTELFRELEHAHIHIDISQAI